MPKLFSISQIFELKYPAKENIARIALLALGYTFEVVSRDCPEMKAEIAGWNEGRTFALGVLPDGPAVTMKKENGRIKYLGRGIKNPSLIIYFKNMDAALMVFTGLMGAHTAAVQNRVIIHGNITESVEVVRAMAIVQAYLFPDFVVRRTYKRPPKFTTIQKWRKAGVMAGLVPGLLLIGGR
jgi:hypothetical protein